MQTRKKFFDVSSADWSTVVSADSTITAAKKALLFMMAARKSDVNLSFAICVSQISPQKLEDDVFKTVDILNLVGKTEEAEALREIAEHWENRSPTKKSDENVAKW